MDQEDEVRGAVDVVVQLDAIVDPHAAAGDFGRDGAASDRWHVEVRIEARRRRSSAAACPSPLRAESRSTASGSSASASSSTRQPGLDLEAEPLVMRLQRQVGDDDIERARRCPSASAACTMYSSSPIGLHAARACASSIASIGGGATGGRDAALLRPRWLAFGFRRAHPGRFRRVRRRARRRERALAVQVCPFRNPCDVDIAPTGVEPAFRRWRARAAADSRRRAVSAKT